MHASAAARRAQKSLSIIGLAIFLGGPALAQDAHLLQQRASFAYREMLLAEREAEQSVQVGQPPGGPGVRLD